MNKLAVIAAFLALSSCATFSGDPESPEESPDQSPPRESAPSAESEAGAETTAPDVPDAPLPEAPAPEPPAEDAAGADPPPEEAGDPEALSEPETPPDPDIPRMTAPQRAADEAPALAVPSLPPASDAPATTAQRGAPESDPGPEPAPPDAEPEPEPAPRAAQRTPRPGQSARQPEPDPEPQRAQPEPQRREPEPEPAFEPEPSPEPQRDPPPPQRNDATEAARQPEPSLSDTRRVAVGDEVRLSLGDGGWVYLGEESGEDGLSFRRRYSEGGETVFVFSVEEPGDYVVRFQRQDLERGVFREERVAVDARPEPAAADGGERAEGTETPSPRQSEATRVAEAFEETPEEPAPSAGLDEAYALLDEGRREAALDAFLQSYPVGDAEVHDLIARLAYELGRWETARSHWSRNLDAEEPFARNARLGLFRTALEVDDAESAWELFRELEEEGAGREAGARSAENPATTTDPAGAATAGLAPPSEVTAPAEAAASEITEEELLRLGNLLLESTDPSRAVGPLEAYMDAGGTPDDPAELYYRLGRLHEDRRDARAAMEYYRRVVDEFPLSRHWQPAEERVQYLRRHFFDIR